MTGEGEPCKKLALPRLLDDNNERLATTALMTLKKSCFEKWESNAREVSNT